MTVRLPSPWAKLDTQVWYWLRSGAPPALAPPQSRLVISYTAITGTCCAALAAPMYAETSDCDRRRVEVGEPAGLRLAGDLVADGGVRESLGLAATQRTTAELGSR